MIDTYENDDDKHSELKNSVYNQNKHPDPK